MKTSKTPISRKAGPDDVRYTLLIARVSTPRQAANDEGSMKDQVQRERAYMEYRRTCGEDWREVDLIELKGISGKDSVRSLEFQALYDQVLEGRANTVLCTALDRVCRSVTDFVALI